MVDTVHSPSVISPRTDDSRVPESASDFISENTDRSSLVAEIEKVCRRIPPSWDLENYVAVNPFLGYTERPLEVTATIVHDGMGAQVLPPAQFYRNQWQLGNFTSNDVERAEKRYSHNKTDLQACLDGRANFPIRSARRVLSFAEQHDRDHGTDWNTLIIQSVARWCAVFESQGGTYWHWSNNNDSLYISWREAASVDRSLEFQGIRGWRGWVDRLPKKRDDAALYALTHLPIPVEERGNYFYRLLAGLYGWASYFRRSGWRDPRERVGEVADLLVIRLCADAAVATLAARGKCLAPGFEQYDVEDENARMVLQEAWEDGWSRRLTNKLVPIPVTTTRERPKVQAVFCIDVRSEPLRRNLEQQSLGIETLGFAGFFGVTLDWRPESGDQPSSCRCPVLLEPAVTLHSLELNGISDFTKKLSDGAVYSAKHWQTAPVSAFSFVETLGLVYGIRMAIDSVNAITKVNRDGRAPFQLAEQNSRGGISLAQRAELAAAILKNTSMRPPYARMVLFCGHEGQSVNNPHAAGLDCGACGGHGGAINTRVVAALLNDPQVRANLISLGWNIPDDTTFVAGVHNTTTDDVTLFEVGLIPASHQKDVQRLQQWLHLAGNNVRQERAANLKLTSGDNRKLHQSMRRRAQDWSQVRPEWALAGNAAFLAARRGRSRAVDFQGRVFLHEYDSELDADDSVLTLILTAPMVVASWINWQYFASTVDNQMFGAGSKTLHNRVGHVGVVLGNGGDLRTGLAVQSVHAAENQWYHEPLRLQVFVEATTDRLDRVIARQSAVSDLFTNGWVRLFSLDRETNTTWQRLRDGTWEVVPC